MSLPIKDGTGASTSLKTVLDGSDHVTYHIVQSIDSTVQVTSSVGSPVIVSGTVGIGSPLNVTVDLSDSITAVISSSDGINTVWVTSSVTNPVHTKTIQGSVTTASISGTPTITGTVGISGIPTVTLSNTVITASISGTQTVTGTVGISELPAITGTVGISGTPTVTGTVHIDNAYIVVTSSQANPVYTTGSIGISGVPTVALSSNQVTASITGTPSITGSVGISGVPTVTGSVGISGTPVVTGTVHVDNDSFVVTASSANPVYVTGTVTVSQPVNVDVNLSDQLTVVVSSSENTNTVWVTSSNSYPVSVKQKTASSVFSNGINYDDSDIITNFSGKTIDISNSYPTAINFYIKNRTDGNVYVRLTQSGSAYITSQINDFTLRPGDLYEASPTDVKIPHTLYIISGSATVGSVGYSVIY
jgi:hypothetical protein